MNSLTVRIKRLSFIVAAALLVAVAPASVNADTAPATGANVTAGQPAAAGATTDKTVSDSTDTVKPTQTAATNKDASADSNYSHSKPAETPVNSGENAKTDVPSTTEFDAGVHDEKSAAKTPVTTPSTATSTQTAAVDSTITSTAKSGNATVVTNTTGGNATTGDASAASTTINSVQSVSGLASSQLNNWTTDIDGDQIGDVLLDPSQFNNLPVASASSNGSLTVNNDSQINNNITLDATSGNATVANNGTAGNATTGNAAAQANVINVVNSFVGASQTFVGTVNIKGNLNGDILLPGTTLADLLKAQARQLPAASGASANSANTTDITNKVSAGAQSGNAAVSNNGAAGNATTGNAITSVNIVNLTGQTVVAKNSMVVFVNVLGKWVGFIVDAPAGVTNAVLGDGVTAQTSNGTPVSNSSTSITNNITVHAASGNATVANNGTAGNATTGNASASANILNMANDNLSLGGWFGILFINVLGSWTGSFGVDTAAGTPPSAGTTGNQPAGTTPTPSAPETAGAQNPQSRVLSANVSQNGQGGPASTNVSSDDSSHAGAVLSANTDAGNTPGTGSSARHSPNFTFAAAGIGVSLLMLLVERALSKRASKRNALKAAAAVATPVRAVRPQTLQTN